MSRNLVLCLDGTANEFKKDRTNVLNLAFAAVKDPNRQLLYYHPGVGTMAPSSVFTRFGQGVARIAGLAFGYGLEADLGCAYSFLIDQYQPGDQVFLFGFSRGAYTARALAALINRYGLLAPGNTALVPYAIRLLWRWHVAKNENDKAKWFSLSEQFKQTLSVGDCPIHFLGVWDTVSSVGWVANPMSLPDTARLPNVSIVRHAVSIDERRAFFRTNLVDKTHGEDRAEVWFPGVHCDVGGGYSEATSGPVYSAVTVLVGNPIIGWMHWKRLDRYQRLPAGSVWATVKAISSITGTRRKHWDGTVCCAWHRIDASSVTMVRRIDCVIGQRNCRCRLVKH